MPETGEAVRRGCYGLVVEPGFDGRPTIRRITAADGETLRGLRISSLVDSPHAFGEPLIEARARPASEWARMARQASHGDARAWFLAFVADRPVGLVRGRRRRPSTLLLFSMWVDPRLRGRGLGAALVTELESWARGWDAVQTILWVFAANRTAIRFYESLGFAVLDDYDADAGAAYGAIAMRRPILGDP